MTTDSTIIELVPDLVERTKAHTLKWRSLGPEMSNTSIDGIGVTVSGNTAYTGTSVVFTVNKPGDRPETVIIRSVSPEYQKVVELLRIVQGSN